MLEAGCKIHAYDPEAMNECKRIIGNKIAYYNNKYDALANADALILLTEWQEFRLPDWDLVGKLCIEN